MSIAALAVSFGSQDVKCAMENGIVSLGRQSQRSHYRRPRGWD